MTLTPIEREFSNILSSELSKEYPINLQADGPLMDPIHPRLIWARLLHQHQLDQQEVTPITGWTYQSFPNISKAEEYFPDISLKWVGKPWCLHEFIQGSSTKALIDFQDWGVAALSKSDDFLTTRGKELHHYAIPVWLTYALSPELWGSQGKWIRFDQELIKILKQKKLLKPESTLGRYCLEPKAESLATKGFPGTKGEDSYVLELPWSFSLSALKKLIQIIEQEF
jgi:hypothetical protein